MSIAPIDPSNLIQRMDALSGQSAGGLALNPTSSVGTVGESFKNYFESAINSVNSDQLSAHQMKTAYTTDESSVSLSRVMVEMQKAEISLSALVTVRNKLLEGYKNIMDMSV